METRYLLVVFNLISKLSLKSTILLFFLIQIISFSIYFSGHYSHFNIANIMSSGIVGLLIFVFLIRSTSNSKVIDKSFLYIFLSLLSWITAEVTYGYQSGFLQEDPYPAIADLFYLSGYIFFVLFLISMNRTYKIELAFIVSSITTFSFFVFYLLYVEIFIFGVFDYNVSVFELILLFTYPIVDIFIVLGAVMYYFRGKSISLNKEHIYWIFIVLFGFFFFVADAIFGYYDLFSIESSDSVFDLYFNIGYLFLGIAIIIRLNYLPTMEK